ncbi:JAB domain-containing protein, partial [Patescibacteria group bacterium]
DIIKIMKYLKKLDIKLVKGEYQNIIKGQVNRPEQVYSVFESLKDKAQETLIAVYLNNDLEALTYNVLSTGSKSETVIDFDDIYGYGFVMKAKYFILIHNHPKGDPAPSKEDEEIIEKFNDYSGIKMKPLDFIIVGDMEMNDSKKNYWSMFEEVSGGEYGLGELI